MELTIDSLRSSLDNIQLQAPDIVFRFEHTAAPLVVTRRHPRDYLRYKWDAMKERRLVGVTTGFAARGGSVSDGFSPIYFDPPLADTIYRLRVVRFIPDSGEISLDMSNNEETDLDTWIVSCKMKSAAVLAATDGISASEREICIVDEFDLQITLHSRKIEFK